MKTAVKGAAKWLLEKAKDNPKLNPVPFPLFKSILEKQITWAREQRRKLSELTGVKVSLIIRYEYCGYIPTKENYNRLAEYFGWPLFE